MIMSFRSLSGERAGLVVRPPPPLAPPLQRSSSFLGEIGGVAKKSGLPMFWQIAQSVRCF